MVVYLDDIVIYSDTLEEHVMHLKKVFKILRDNQLYVKREKCEFAQPKVHFLGHVISQGELRMDEEKVKAIRDWEAPTKVTELRSFLGGSVFGSSSGITSLFSSKTVSMIGVKGSIAP